MSVFVYFSDRSWCRCGERILLIAWGGKGRVGGLRLTYAFVSYFFFSTRMTYIGTGSSIVQTVVSRTFQC